MLEARDARSGPSNCAVLVLYGAGGIKMNASSLRRECFCLNIWVSSPKKLSVFHLDEQAIREFLERTYFGHGPDHAQ